MFPDPKKPIPNMPPLKKGKRILGCDGCDERDAEIERLRAALQEVATVLYDARRAYHNSEQWRGEGPDGCDGPSFDDLFCEAFAKGGVTP